MDPEQDELESPSAGTGLEAPGQQCPPNEGIREIERTTTAVYLPRAWVHAKAEIFRHPRNVRTRKRLQISLRQLRPRQNAGTIHLANKTSSSTPGEKERRHRLAKRL